MTRQDKVSVFLQCLLEQLQPFAMHRFMAGHQHQLYRDVVSQLQMDEIVVIHDFAENYSVIVPNEVQSMHWVNIQATVYVSVITRHDTNSTPQVPILVDEHHIFISEDTNHDCHFVNHCKTLLLDRLSLPITRIFEFCDGAASQFKSSTALAYIACSTIPTIRYYWETSHGKHKADGAGGVIKQSAKMSVVRKDNIIRGALELFQFCDAKLKKIGDGPEWASRRTKTVRREFYYIEPNVVQHNGNQWKTVKGTRSFHEVRSTMNELTILVRDIGCACDQCLGADQQPCADEALVGPLQEKNLVKCTMAEPVDDDLDATPAIEYAVEVNDICVIRSADEDRPYVLMKITRKPHVLITDVRDDDGNIFSAGLNVVGGNYYVQTAEAGIWRLCNEKLSYVLFCNVVPIHCELEERGTNDDGHEIYSVSSDVDEAILSILL